MAYNTLIDYNTKNIASLGSTYVDIGFDHEQALTDTQSIISNIGDRRYVLDNMVKISRLADTVDLIKQGGFDEVSIDLESAITDAREQIAVFAVGEVRNYVDNNDTIQQTMETYSDVLKAVNMTQTLNSLVSDSDFNGVLSIGKDMVMGAAMAEMDAFLMNEDVQAVSDGATDVLRVVSEMQTISGFRDILGTGTFEKFVPAKAKATVETLRNIKETINNIKNIAGGLEDITSMQDAFSDIDGLIGSVEGIASLLGGSEIFDSIQASMTETKETVDNAVEAMETAKAAFDIAGGLF